MNTWKIKSSHYYSHDDRRRDVKFNLCGVTIITGESSTGKSAVIDTVNYCLGSSDCDIGNFIEERCAYVAIVLTNGSEDLFVCRKIPSLGNKASSLMQVIRASVINVPNSLSDLNVKNNKDSALQLIQTVLGIGEVNKSGDSGTKVSVRNIIPYIFLNDEVIISKRQALYGLERKKAKHVVDSYPYFIGAINEKTLADERELFGLKKAVEKESNRLDKMAKENEQTEKDADDILLEALNLGLIENSVLESEYSEKFDFLTTINELTQKKPPSKSSTIFNELNLKKRTLLKKLSSQEKELQSANSLSVTSSQFGKTLNSQKNSLGMAGLFKKQYSSKSCPLCESQIASANDVLETVNSAYASIVEEVDVAEKRIPKIESYIDELLSKVEQSKKELGLVENQIKLIVNQNHELSKIEDRYAFVERLKGKIDLFLKLQERKTIPTLHNLKYNEYKAKIEDIEGRLDPELIEEQIKAADNEVAKHATSILKTLPTAVPCKNNSMYFSSKNMSISILEESGNLIPMNKIKSDQNYLALHISLILGLQKELQKRKRPVPGFIFIDQVSRPYYPADKNNEYKKEIKLDANDEDKEVSSVKAYFDLLFNETENNKSLQVIVLEHAYFENDTRFKKSVKYRWTDETGDALIPLDWPVAD